MNIKKIENSFKVDKAGKCAVAKKGMVSTASPHATRAGVEMLEKGGNAIDAICAAALALGVCEPQSSGIGGQSMGILHTAGKTICIDGSSRVPSLAHARKLLKLDMLNGHWATTVPSTVAVLGHMNFHYGQLEWKQIVEPAIRIAYVGYKITELQSRLQKRELENFFKVPMRSGAKYFLKNGNTPYEEGDLFVQRDLGETLEYLADNGPRSFYQGRIARLIHEDMRENKGFLRADDLALIPWPIERRSIRRKYRDVSVHTIPPPAAGRSVLLVLLMLDYMPPKFIKSGSPESYHFIAEIFRKALLHHRQRPYIPDAYPQVSDKRMISRTYAHELAKSIKDNIDPNLPIHEPPGSSGDTTHLSAMDDQGNAVGITQSIELPYGSKAVTEGLGFLYNNYVNSLEFTDPSHPYYLRPNAIAWSSVSPAIVLYKKQPWIVTGSPGSERIYTAISQFLLNMLDKGMDMGSAMEYPRFHCSIGGKITIEADRFDPAIIKHLENMGYEINPIEPYSFYLGAIHSVMKCLKSEGFQGVAEIRRDGTAEGIS